MTKPLVTAALAMAVCAASGGAQIRGGQPVALVTAEQQNQLLAVQLPQGKVVRRASLPADPENVIGGPGLTTVAVSAKAGAVTLLDWRTLQITKIFRDFSSPHLAAFSPDGEYAYVTDDGSGLLTVIRLARPRIVARLFVGLGAHHLTVEPNGNQVWIALGERARSIAIVDTRDRRRPRLVSRFDPGFAAHDLVFSPDGRRIWITSDDGPTVHVLSARTRKPLFSVAVGPPPQHIAFNYQTRELAGRVWLTTGYGSRIVLADANNGRVLRVHKAPYGSFNLAMSGSFVVTSSLLTGTVAEFTDTLRLLRTVKVADSTRDVAVTVW